MQKFYVSLSSILLCGFFLLYSQSTQANHIIGGEFTVTHLEGNQFQARLVLYRDCNSGGAPLDGSVTISVFEQGTDDQLTELNFSMNLGEVTFPELGDNCFSPDICLEIGEYLETITLPDNPNGYYLTWERCCRTDAGVINTQTVDQGMVFTATIADPALQNSTPVFNPYPFDGYLCTNFLNNIDYGATDVDGDSLVYKLITPLAGSASSAFNPAPFQAGPQPYDELDWQAGYGVDNVIGGTTPMEINSETGLVTGQPAQQGLFTVAVLVEEYRDGVLLSEIRRELLLASLVCSNDVPSEIEFPELAADSTQFILAPGQELCLDILVIDSNEGDTLIFQASGEILDELFPNPAEFESDSSLTGELESSFCWTPRCEELREEPYIVTFTAFSRGCSQEVFETTLEIEIFVQEEEPYTAILGSSDSIFIDLYNPATHCFSVNVQDTNLTDTVYAFYESPIFDFPTADTLFDAVGFQSITQAMCWDVTCAEVRDEPYPIDITVVSRNCTTNDTVFFTVNVFVGVQPNLPTLFDGVPDEVTWTYYDQSEFCLPVGVVDGNYFDTLQVTAEGSLLTIPGNEVTFDTLSGNSELSGEICLTPRCVDVREEPYLVTFTATANSCLTDDVVTKTVEVFIVLPDNESTQFTAPTTLVYDHMMGEDDSTAFLVNAFDPNFFDTLTLNLINNPDLLVKPLFNDTSGNGSVTSIFDWEPTCMQVSRDPHIFQFEVITESCQRLFRDTLEVEIFVSSPTFGDIGLIPNIFTPNNDNRNDRFDIQDEQDICLENFNARVFNRWGKEVYLTSDREFEWDGELDGTELPGGTYFYTLQYTFQEVLKTFSGNVEILR